jgi:hypothetical protein
MFDSSGVFTPIDLGTFDGLWWLITGKAFAAQMFAYKGEALWHEIQWFIGHLSRAFMLIGIGPGILGIGVLFRKNWRLGGLLLLLFVLSAFFYIDYRVMDKETMFLPTYVVWAIWLGIGTQWLADWISTSSEPLHVKKWTGQIFQGLMLIGVFMAVLYTGPKVDLSDDWTTRTRGESILKNVEPNALIFGFWDTVPVIQYLQLVEGQRPDVTAVNRFLITFEDLTDYAMDEVENRPVNINAVPVCWDTLF